MKGDSFLSGVVVGALAPVAAHVLKVFTPLGATMHPLSLYVAAAVVNLVLIRLFYRRALEQRARGLLMMTFVAVLLLIFVEKLSLT